MITHRMMLAACALLVLLVGHTAWADPKINVVATFESQGADLGVATMNSEGIEFVLIRVQNGKLVDTFLVDKGSSGKLTALWKKAQAGGGASFSKVGTITEAGGSSPSQLTLSAGPGVQFVISNPKNPKNVTFNLSKGDEAKFDAALTKASAALK